MKYKDFELEDFLANKEFIEWVKKPMLESNIYWQKWIEIHPHKKETIDRAKEIVLSIQYPKLEMDKQSAVKILNNIIAEKYSHRNTTKADVGIKKQGSSRNLFYARAAAVLILLVSVIFYFTYVNHSNKDADLPKQITKSNPNGRKLTIFLPDGSKVKLNSDSKISYFTDFNSNRKVHLSGEAFFSVKKGAVPFQVHTQNLTITVLGTKFNVKAFAEELKESISLVEGSVKIENKRNNNIGIAILEEGEKLVFDEKENVTYKHPLEPDELAWKDGYLVFNKTGVSEFIQMIRRWYGVEVTVLGKPDAQWEITGKYKTHSLDLLLQSIKFDEDIDYNIYDKTVELHIN